MAKLYHYLLTPEGLTYSKRFIGLVTGGMVITVSILSALISIVNPFRFIRHCWNALFGLLMIFAQWPVENPTIGRFAPQKTITKTCGFMDAYMGRFAFFAFVGTTLPEEDNTFSFVAGGFAIFLAIAELALGRTVPGQKRGGPGTPSWPPEQQQQPAASSAGAGAGAAAGAPPLGGNASSGGSDGPAWARGAANKAPDMVAVVPPPGGSSGYNAQPPPPSSLPPPGLAPNAPPGPPPDSNPTPPASSTWPPPGGDDAPPVWPPPQEDGV